MKRRSVLPMIRIDGRKPSRCPIPRKARSPDENPLYLPDVSITADDEREVAEMIQQHGILSPA